MLSLNIYVYKYLSICLSVVYHIYKLIYVLQGLKELSRLVLFLGGTRISRKFLFSLAFSLPPSILSLIRVHDTQIRREISLFFVFYTLSPFFFLTYTHIYMYVYTFFFLQHNVQGLLKYGDWGWTSRALPARTCTSHNSLVTSTET